jgi:hypothetical protein
LTTPLKLLSTTNSQATPGNQIVVSVVVVVILSVFCFSFGARSCRLASSNSSQGETQPDEEDDNNDDDDGTYSTPFCILFLVMTFRPVVQKRLEAVSKK